MAMFLGNRPAGGHILHYSRLGYLGLFAVCGREDARPTSLLISERYLVCGPGGLAGGFQVQVLGCLGTVLVGLVQASDRSSHWSCC